MNERTHLMYLIVRYAPSGKVYSTENEREDCGLSQGGLNIP